MDQGKGWGYEGISLKSVCDLLLTQWTWRNYMQLFNLNHFHQCDPMDLMRLIQQRVNSR